MWFISPRVESKNLPMIDGGILGAGAATTAVSAAVSLASNLLVILTSTDALNVSAFAQMSRTFRIFSY